MTGRWKGVFGLGMLALMLTFVLVSTGFSGLVVKQQNKGITPSAMPVGTRAMVADVFGQDYLPAVVGEVQYFSAQNCSNAGGIDNVTFYFGDGTPGYWEEANNAYSHVFTHTYDHAGIYTVKIVIYDAETNTTAEDTDYLVVFDHRVSGLIYWPGHSPSASAIPASTYEDWVVHVVPIGAEMPVRNNNSDYTDDTNMSGAEWAVLKWALDANYFSTVATTTVLSDHIIAYQSYVMNCSNATVMVWDKNLGPDFVMDPVRITPVTDPNVDMQVDVNLTDRTSLLKQSFKATLSSDFRTMYLYYTLDLRDMSDEIATALDIWGAANYPSVFTYDGNLSYSEASYVVNMITYNFLVNTTGPDYVPHNTQSLLYIDSSNNIYNYVENSVVGVSFTGYGNYLEGNTSNLTVTWRATYTLAGSINTSKTTHQIYVYIVNNTNTWDRVQYLQVPSGWEITGFIPPQTTRADSLIDNASISDDGSTLYVDGGNGTSAYGSILIEKSTTTQVEETGGGIVQEEEAWWQPYWDWIMANWLTLVLIFGVLVLGYMLFFRRH